MRIFKLYSLSWSSYLSFPKKIQKNQNYVIAIAVINKKRAQVYFVLPSIKNTCRVDYIKNARNFNIFCQHSVSALWGPDMCATFRSLSISSYLSQCSQKIQKKIEDYICKQGVLDTYCLSLSLLSMSYLIMLRSDNFNTMMVSKNNLRFWCVLM